MSTYHYRSPEELARLRALADEWGGVPSLVTALRQAFQPDDGLAFQFEDACGAGDEETLSEMKEELEEAEAENERLEDRVEELEDECNRLREQLEEKDEQKTERATR